jgi:hypothetical protein
MSFIRRLIVALKFLHQFGLRPLALFALYKLGLIIGHYRRAENKERETSHREQLKQVLGDDGQPALIAEADEITAYGKFRMFGATPVDIKLTLDGPLQHWTAYETNQQLLSTLYSLIPDINSVGTRTLWLGIHPRPRLSPDAREQIRRSLLEIF